MLQTISLVCCVIHAYENVADSFFFYEYGLKYGTPSYFICRICEVRWCNLKRWLYSNYSLHKSANNLSHLITEALRLQRWYTPAAEIISLSAMLWQYDILLKHHFGEILLKVVDFVGMFISKYQLVPQTFFIFAPSVIMNINKNRYLRNKISHCPCPCTNCRFY